MPRPIQPTGTEAGMNGMPMIHCSASPASTASAHAIGGRMMTLGVSAVSFMTGMGRICAAYFSVSWAMNVSS
jgi:hypothetical protein